MTFLNLFFIVSGLVTTVFLQDPPPIFDMPLPPSIDPPLTEKDFNQTAISLGDTVIDSAVEADNGTLSIESNVTVVASADNSELNDSSPAVTDFTTSGDISEVTSGNETLTANATDAAADTLSVLETTSNVTGVETVETKAETNNLTVISFTDEAITDILAATVDESAINNTIALPEIKSDNMTSADTSNITAVDTLETKDSNFTSIDETIGTSLEINATDTLVQTEPVDLPPPPISLDLGLQNDSLIRIAEANVSDIQTQLDSNITSAVDTNETLAGNKTYIDEVNIYINDSGISIEHTPVIHIEPGSETQPIPVDVPSLPQDKPSVDFIETSDSTTIEISDLFGALPGFGLSDKVSPPMENTALETTTLEMPPVSTDSTFVVPAVETTTQSQLDVFTSQPTFDEYATSTSKPVIEHQSNIHVPTEEIAPLPDHPPPIFSGGSRPSVYTDPYGPHEGHFPVIEQTTTPKPVTKKALAPPPIIVPTVSHTRPNWSGHRFDRTTASPYPKWPVQAPTTVSGLNPRHMNVAELAAYALQIASKKTQSNQNAQGIQVFFPTEPQTTTARPTLRSPETPVKSIREHQAIDFHQDKRSNAFVEYLRNKYGIGNVAPTTPYFTTTAKPAVRLLQKPQQRKFYDADYLLSHLPERTTQKPTLKKFFDSRYLLSHLDMANSKSMIPTLYTTTTVTPKPTTSRHFFNEKFLLSHLGELQGSADRVKPTLPLKPSVPAVSKRLPQQSGLKQQLNVPSNQQSWLNGANIKSSNMPKIGTERIQEQSIIKEQRQGQVETRPINLKPNINPQSFINYNLNPERNVRMNINLKPDINQWREQTKANMFTQPPDKSNNAFASLLSQVTRTTSNFKPVVYGTKPFNTVQQSAGLSLRNRFNKKWYHPEDKKVSQTNSAVRNTNIQIEKPSKVSQAISVPSSRGNTVLTGAQNNAMQSTLGEFTLQHTNIEVQRQLLKQQEMRLRQQQQQLQEQEAVLLRQQQEQQRQQHQQKQQQLLLQQQEHDRLLQLKYQQEQQRQQQKQQEHILQQREHDSFHQRQLQLELQRQQQQLKQQEAVVKQQEHDRLLQQQLQRQLQLERQLKKEQEINTQRKSQQLDMQGNQFPLASRTGRSEILKNSQQRHHIYQPNVQLSSIQIFRAPAMLKKRRNKEIQRSKEALPQTHWRAPSDLQHLHGHIPVPYNLKQTTGATPKPTTPVTNVYIATVATTTVRATTLPPLPTEPATADPNPPPIFDTKVRHTFMPMPKIEPTTKGPKLADNAVTGFDGTQPVNAQIDERCRGCVFVNDRCLLPDPVHCNFFIECVRQGNLVRAFSRECALGSFFDRKSFLCVDPKNADCPTDRCRTPGTKWYAIQGHCKHYWSCGAREGGGVFAQSECCPDMGGFVEPDGCVENPNCTDTCSSPIIMEGPTGVANCTCSNETSCSCSGASQATLRASSCLPILSLPFDGGRLQDASNTKQHIGVEGISATMEGEAIYNGQGRLVLWRYANLMFPVVFAVKFRFYSTAASPRQQIIFSNCDTKGGLEPSIIISLDTMFHEVVFNINTYKGPAKRFTITYQQNKWTTVDFIYDGERIVGSVDRRARNIFAGGGIESRPNPIGVGSCSGKDGFKGLLDDLFVYEQCIPDEMYGVFMSVLE